MFMVYRIFNVLFVANAEVQFMVTTLRRPCKERRGRRRREKERGNGKGRGD